MNGLALRIWHPSRIADPARAVCASICEAVSAVSIGNLDDQGFTGESFSQSTHSIK